MHNSMPNIACAIITRHQNRIQQSPESVQKGLWSRLRNSYLFLQSHAMTAQPPTPFRFLDLPNELHLMTYEHIAITTRHYTLRYAHPISQKSLVVRSLPTAFLETCRLICSECQTGLARKRRNLSYSPLLYYIVPKPQLPAFCRLANPLCRTENVARQQHWRTVNQVTISTLPYPYSFPWPNLPPFNLSETVFMKKMRHPVYPPNPTTLLVFVQKAHEKYPSNFMGQMGTSSTHSPA
jgi:hypothetical protein